VTSDYITLKSIRLDPSRHKPTGNVRHYNGGNPFPPTAELKIMRYEGTSGFYLLHFDIDGNELNDTYHDSLEDALHQAEYEFRIEPSEWIDATR
jgi:hypothetical protein